MISRRDWFVISGVAVAVVLAMYLRTLHFGLYWDDFDDLRPWTWADLARAFVGPYQPWAREGIYFYRPLTSVYFASATWLFGLNATMLHVIPLLVISIAATLTGVFAQRETQSRAVGIMGTVIYAAHPLTASAIGPWIANQYQGLLVIAVLAALLIWQPLPRRELRLTPALCAAIIAAAWLKEDGLMLAPAILAVHAMRALITRDVPMPSRRAAGAFLGIAAALMLWRAWWLPSQLGYGAPEITAMAINVSRAWRYVFVWHSEAGWLGIALTIVKVAMSIAVLRLLIGHRHTPAARLAVVSLALMTVMNVPLSFVSSENRWHVVGLCAVLAAVSALAPLSRAARWVAFAAAVGIFAVSANQRIETFAPCSSDSLEHYRWAATLPELPAQMHEWLQTRDAACASGAFDHFTVPMDQMTWGQR